MSTRLTVHDGKIAVVPPRSSYDELKQLPGASYHSKTDTWYMPLAYSSCVMLRSVFGRSLEVDPTLAEWVRSERAAWIDPNMELRTAKDYPMLKDWSDTRYEMRDYQKPAAVFMTNAKRVINGDDMRLGKSATSIIALRLLHDAGEDVFPAIIFAPPSVKRVWVKQFQDWWPDVKVVAPKSGLAAAEKALVFWEENESQVIVLHYEVLALLSRIEGYGAEALKPCKTCNPESKLPESKCQIHPKALNTIKWKTVIADEVHRISEPAALMTRAAKVLRQGATNIWGLTGTPPENPDRLWCVLNFISPEEYPSKTKFRDRFVVTEINYWSGFPESKGWKTERREEFNRFFHPRFIRRTKEMVHTVVAPTPMVREPEMTPKQAKAYKDLKSSYMAEVEGGVFWADSPGAKIQRLRQLASAFAEVDGDNNFHLSEPSNKLDDLMELLADLGDEQAAIFAEQAQLIELAYLRLKDQSVKIVGGMSEAAREYAVRAFEEGEARYILCTTAAGGEGISLATAQTLIFLQRPYSRKDNVQSENRIYQEDRASLIVDIITPNTVDGKVLDSLSEKDASFEELVQDRILVKEWLK